MKEQLVITRIFRAKKQTRFGEKDSLAIKTTKYGDKWLSTFKTKGTEGWAENDTVEVFVEKKGEFLNFSLEAIAGGVSPELEARVKKLEDKVFGIKTEDTPPDDDF